ncbi:MAG: SRPBCC family protein, partial [Gammaproteobacteria bacterium]
MLKCAEGAERVPVALIRALAARLFRDAPRRDKIPAWVQGSDQMKFTMMVLSLGASLGGSAAWADPPKTLRVTESVEIKAPIDEVWATVRDFDSLNKWHPGFASDELVSGGNGKVGAVRKLTIKDGPTFTERLLAFDAAHHSYRYK